MNSLIFIYNNLLNPHTIDKLKLPLTFISYAIAKGKMYKHFKIKDTFLLSFGENRQWGNQVIYGALFLCDNFEFYSRVLDAYHMCSMSTMKMNHIKDLHHRVTYTTSPIYFKTLEDMYRLKYREDDAIQAITYVGNTNHPNIYKRLTSKKLNPDTNKGNSYRIEKGIDRKNFEKLFKKNQNN